MHENEHKCETYVLVCKRERPMIHIGLVRMREKKRSRHRFGLYKSKKRKVDIFGLYKSKKRNEK